MVTNPVAARYAEALFEFAKRHERLDETFEQVEALGELIRRSAELRQLLINPGVDAPGKIALLGRLLGGWRADVRVFVELVLSFGRIEQLLEMVEALRRLMDGERGLVRVTVRSARPLDATVRGDLVKTIEQREGRRADLTEETDPQLLGGLQVFVEGRMLDGSLRSRLEGLRQQLKRVKVH
ncbi:MAG TPA: ATP synthase F1 subunit delta [Candidatus Omnitrophica bacterium]|nr:MAG: ATP synthase F1 subunit delta [Omnitrophica WOR_2 bacterium GWA2_63_20]OGX17625.1 MAG: ATP synthase F1 subunit delta [Omnitrophica WOR_2 bacterium GWF2_63_9]OGX36478.1 MAG: ATP synthase F1 subunit delta [Omnitrophica WOR_2 bacterium RIFCSPHIGHO2_02_FULL_63_39]OGX44819.1 MAG: ATP synthase F1 subunit delta [Omnitrophica WOR_2 bacterium RIFCSPLOWO2_02_FULL_63_16]OGX48050.1 MAG: ATP synthase F1 subunit delta [Omnitrophica WOR_2 bacterium RIFCSPLOWO2_12_FULL_63_16]HBH97285.1 ATP synthase F1